MGMKELEYEMSASRSMPIYPTSGPVRTGMGDRVRVQIPVRDIYLGMLPATQVNSAWPCLRGLTQRVPAKGR